MKYALIIAMLGVATSAIAQHSSNIRIACVGASITEGGMTTNPATDSYPAQLGTMLGDGYEVMNFGVSSSTMLKEGDFPYWTKGRLDEALASEPDIVFIDLGGNDAKAVNRDKAGRLAADAAEMANLFRSLPSHPRVIFLTPIVSFETDPNQIWDITISETIAPAIVSAAYDAGVEVIDMHPVLETRPELFPDGIHPDTEGSRMMAQTLKDYLLGHPQTRERHSANSHTR